MARSLDQATIWSSSADRSGDTTSEWYRMTSMGEGMPSKERVSDMGHQRGLPVHQPVGPNDPAAECLADGLVAQADAQHGHPPRRPEPAAPRCRLHAVCRGQER